MKKKLFIVGLIFSVLVLMLVSLVVITGVQCCNTAADGSAAAAEDRRPSGNEAALAADAERISVYSVPLRCPLVTNLGCGSESKPIMTKLDSDPAVEGVWLNHAGTTLAVLWKAGTNATERSQAIASALQNPADTKELSGDARASSLKNFLSGVAWYRTVALDELSGQEADIVAARWVNNIARVIPLPHRAREAVRRRLSDEMRCRFVSK